MVLARGRPLGTQHRLEAYAYATLTFRSVKRCLKSTCREVRGPTATAPAGECSIGFQPVSGFPTGNISEIASQPLDPPDDMDTTIRVEALSSTTLG
jgi:hypothetical protein